jgi:hypothetical protein
MSGFDQCCSSGNNTLVEQYLHHLQSTEIVAHPHCGQTFQRHCPQASGMSIVSVRTSLPASQLELVFSDVGIINSAL